VWDVETGAQVLDIPYAIGGFARDGRRFAGGVPDAVAFGELVIPSAARRLTGHRAPVALVAWSRDNRRLASTDDRFELRLWDVTRGVTVCNLPLSPPDPFFANNSAVAVSDDGQLVAYASGGRKEAVARIYSAATGQLRAEWALPGGFESLAATGDATFLLV